MHAQNPFASDKPINEIKTCFSEWLTKIIMLLNHHKIGLVGGEVMLVAIMERKDNGLPQVVLFEKIH